MIVIMAVRMKMMPVMIVLMAVLMVMMPIMIVVMAMLMVMMPVMIVIMAVLVVMMPVMIVIMAVLVVMMPVMIVIMAVLVVMMPVMIVIVAASRRIFDASANFQLQQPGGNALLDNPRRIHTEWIDRQLPQLLGDVSGIGAQIDQSGQRHVPGNTGKTIQIQQPHPECTSLASCSIIAAL